MVILALKALKNCDHIISYCMFYNILIRIIIDSTECADEITVHVQSW